MSALRLTDGTRLAPSRARGRPRLASRQALILPPCVSRFRNRKRALRPSARNKLLSERPMAAASARSIAAKKKQESGLCSMHPVRPPKRPIKKHRPKLAKTSPNCHFSSVFAQDKQPALPVANNSATFYTKHTKPQQQNPLKKHKK